MPTKILTGWLDRISHRDLAYGFAVLIAGFYFWYIEWGLDWEELPDYVVSGLILYLLGRISYYRLGKHEFIPAAGVVMIALGIGLLEWGFDAEELAYNGILGLIIYLVLRAFYYVMTLGLGSVEEVPPIVQAENEIIVYLVLSLRNRARKLKLSGRFVLLAIFLAIVGGIQVFYTADVVARSNSGEFQLEKLVREFELRTDYGRGGRPRRVDPEEGAETDSLKEFLSKVKEIVKAETDRFIKNSESDPQEIIISTLTTRIGTIFLLLFLVQILVSLYRYSTKLAALYDGRADLLQLLPNSEELDIEKLVKLTATDSLDFAKQEKAPADYAIELAKKIIDKSEKES